MGNQYTKANEKILYQNGMLLSSNSCEDSITTKLYSKHRVLRRN